MKSVELRDILNYRFLSEPRFSPDGKRAAFVLSTANEEENSYESRLYLYENGETRQLTDLGKERGYVWLDENRLLFPAVRSAAEKKRAESKDPFTAYYCLDLRGGEALPLVTLPFAARSLKVLDATHFAVTASIDRHKPDLYKADEAAREAERKEREANADYEVYDELPFWFNGAGVTNGQRSALFLVSLEPFSVERVTAPEEDVSALTVLGEEILFASSSYTQKMPIAGCRFTAVNWRTGETRSLGGSGTLSVSALETVGERVLLFGTEGKRYGLNENNFVYTLDPGTGEIALLRAEEYSMYSSVGSDCRYGGGRSLQAEGDALYHLSTREGSSWLCRLDPDGSDTPVVTKDGSIDAFAVSGGKALLVALYDMGLQELYEADLNTGALQRVSHFNDEALTDVYVAQPVPLTVESEGYTIGGWVLPPKNFDPEKTYPAVYDIHGGPKTVFGPVFYHEMQLWAGRGYFVFYCNPKGSDGRDNAFADIRGDYGGTDYKNLMAFADAVLAAWPQIDPKRVCETGGSYGGFMTNWIIGHTDRFCCAASQRSISNWLSFYGVSDIGFYFATDQNKTTFEDFETLWAHSPLKYAAHVKTPTLFIHSDEDYRCPVDQGMQMYAALADLGVPARLCLFHGENHELSRSGKPKHRLRRLQEITDWFDTYSK